MKKIICVFFLSCFLCSFLGCNMKQVNIPNKEQDIPFNGVYNEKKNILITAGMSKSEIDSILGDYEILYDRNFTYFADDEENKIVILYDITQTTSWCIGIESNNWRVHDESCDIGVAVSDLSANFVHTSGIKEGSKRYSIYYDESGNILEDLSSKTIDNKIYTINVVTENNYVLAIFVGEAFIRLPLTEEEIEIAAQQWLERQQT